MRVLLINPPREIPQLADFPPMGLAYIGAALKEHGFEVKVLDGAALSWRALEKKIRQFPAQMIGISCWTVERAQAYRTAKLARFLHPQAKIIVGGPHATAFPKHLFELSQADVVVVGQGEETVLELAEHFQGSGRPLKEIKGIVYKEQGQFLQTPPREFIKDLDKIPFPLYDDFDLKKYNGLPEISGPVAALITSRGCPYQCAFCAASRFWHRRWLYRSSENVLKEIEWLLDKFALEGIFFFDDLFALKKDRAMEICKGIVARGWNLKWAAESNVRSVDEELLTWMRRSGCYRLDFGVESGSPKILQNIRKPQKAEDIKRAFSLAKKVGIKPRAYLMVGNPGEDEDTIAQTIALMKEIDPYFSPTGQLLWILPDTEIYDLAKEQGIISDDFWLESNDMAHYTGEHSLEELMSLRNQLMKGLAKNQGTLKAYLEYLFLRMYYRFPVVRKFYHKTLAKASSLFNFLQR